MAFRFCVPSPTVRLTESENPEGPDFFTLVPRLGAGPRAATRMAPNRAILRGVLVVSDSLQIHAATHQLEVTNRAPDVPTAACTLRLSTAQSATFSDEYWSWQESLRTTASEKEVAANNMLPESPRRMSKVLMPMSTWKTRAHP